MVAVTSAYASGTVGAVSGAVTTVAGVTPAAAWVGRCVRLTSGSGSGQIRKITAVSGQDVTTDFAWSVSPIPDITDVDPAVGDSLAVSNFLSELADGSTLVYDSTTESLLFSSGSHSFSGNAFVYDTNRSITLHSQTITLGTGACWRLGDLDSTGRWSNGCRLQDVGNYVATTSGGWVGGVITGNSGDLHLYGCIVDAPNNDVFWRLYRGSAHVVRFIGCVFSRRFGGRVQGSKSAIIDVRFSGSTSVISPINPVSPFGIVRRLDSSNSAAGLYHQFGLGQNALVDGFTFSNVGALLSVSDGANNAAPYTLEVADINITEAQALGTFLALGGFPWVGNQPTVRISNYVTINQTDTQGAAVTDLTRAVMRDVTGATVYNATSTTGAFPRQRLRYKDIKYPSVGNVNFTFNGAPGVVYAGYSLLLVAYGRLPYTKSISLNASETVNAVMLEDASVTRSAASAATLSSAISINSSGHITISGSVTLDDLYDYAAYWITLSPTNALVANGLLITSAGGVLSLTTNVTISEGGALSSGTYATAIATDGLITATGSISVAWWEDATGRRVQISLSGLLSGARVQVYNTSTSTQISNTVATGSTLSVYATYFGDFNVRIRVAYVSGVTAKNEYQTTGIVGAAGLSVAVVLTDDTVYNNNAVNGATVGEFTADYPNVQVDVSDPDGITTAQRLYAWLRHNATLSGGIGTFFGAATAEDSANYRINTAVVALKLDNVSALPVVIGGARLYRDDGASVIASGAIQMDPGRAFTATDIAAAVSARPTLSEIERAGGMLDGVRANAARIPAIPAEVGSAMTLTSAYDAAKTAASQSSVNAIPTAPLLAANYTAPDNASIAAIKAKTDNLPASPAATGAEMTLTLGERNAVVAAVWAAAARTLTANPGDTKEQIAAQVQSAIERTGGMLDGVRVDAARIPSNPAVAGGQMALSTSDALRLLEIFQRLGLDPAAPMTTAADSITFDGKTIDIAEAGGSVTLTRQP